MYHHIVARNAPKAELGRMVLARNDIKIEDKRNKVRLKKSFHVGIYIKKYHLAVGRILRHSEKIGNSEFERNSNVSTTLRWIKEGLEIINAGFPG